MQNSSNRVIAISGSGNLPERISTNCEETIEPSLEQMSTLEKLPTCLPATRDNWHDAVSGLRSTEEAMWGGFTPTELETLVEIGLETGNSYFGNDWAI